MNLINISLKACPVIGQVEGYELIFEMSILGLKNLLLFIAFFDFYATIRVCGNKLGKLLDTIAILQSAKKSNDS